MRLLLFGNVAPQMVAKPKPTVNKKTKHLCLGTKADRALGPLLALKTPPKINLRRRLHLALIHPHSGVLSSGVPSKLELSRCQLPLS
jgi:hypothetical protein